MALTVADALKFFKSLDNDKGYRRAYGVTHTGEVVPFFMQELLLDSDVTPTKGITTIQTEPTVSRSMPTKQWLDLSKAEDPAFLFVDLYHTKNEMVFGEAIPILEPRQFVVATLGAESTTIILNGYRLISSVEIEDLPAEISTISMVVTDYETLSWEFLNTAASEITLSLHLKSLGGVSKESFILVIK